MKTKMVIRRYAALAAVALLCCGGLLINSSARPQCPDSTFPGPNPDSIPWEYDSTYQEIPGTDCYVTIYFCDRILGGDTVQCFLEGISVDSSTDCDSISPTAIIEAAGTLIDNDPAVNHGVNC